MAVVKIKYYRIKRNRRAFWEPTPNMRRLGFRCVPLGPDGPAAWSKAEEWNDYWADVRIGSVPPPNETGLKEGERGNVVVPHSERKKRIRHDASAYPPGSIGRAFSEYRELNEWIIGKRPATKEQWFRAWKLIAPIFGDVDPNTVTMGQLSEWRAHIEKSISPGEAWLAMTKWRALWSVMIALRYTSLADPSASVPNPAPPPRNAIFKPGEVIRIIKEAWRQGYKGLACIVALAWDGQLSPIDARTLTRAQRCQDDDGVWFTIVRVKTGQKAIAALSRRTVKLIDAYQVSLETSGLYLYDDVPMFRMRAGGPYRNKTTLARDFRKIRDAVIPGDDRKLMDLRRTGATEAVRGGVDAAHLAKSMGNSIDKSKRLQDTYIDHDVTVVRMVQKARKRGRS